MKKIGLFICHCGSNIAGTIDIPEVKKFFSEYDDIEISDDYKYMCSEPGQKKLRDAIVERGLNGVVVACCSPRMHEITFRNAAVSAGLNPYKVEIANIREQCSWVHQKEKDKATKKSIDIIKTMIEKVKRDEALQPIEFDITKRALVIGGGIAGITAAVDIANAGYEVVLVEKRHSIGGKMLELSETFPTLDCAQCTLTPKTVEAGRHPKIKLMVYSEVEEVKGYIGNFDVKIRRKASYVDWNKCTGCGLCQEKCPSKTESEFDHGLGERKAIYTLSPQAVPNKPIIDKNSCRFFREGKCRVCEKVCPVQAINYEMKDEVIEEKVGAIVVATGYEILETEKIPEYGYGMYKDVIDGLQFERLNSASGPTAGEIRRPSDGKVPKEVVFIKCVGSRDPEKGIPYCSRICCMYLGKHARLYKHKVPDGQAYLFYMDIRSFGKGYEEFIQQSMEEANLLYIRGRVARIMQEGDKLVVWGVDTLSGRKVEIKADMVVLGTAVVPSKGATELAKVLRTATDEYGFFNEAHIKLKPVESMTGGIYLAGCAQAPKDIPDTVAQAGAAAAKVLSLFGQEKMVQEPLIACVDTDLCSGCGVCVTACPFDARMLDVDEKISIVNEALCQGCGACVSACPNKACQLRNASPKTYMAMVDKYL
ncbi:MAG: CoB--CoM heterodisulfide reductase iron-sulfur subunit A family protein [Proteobacteria bacterium]|nr:CoB--CoM heterodisulfide reductase iron-sulfur subunit A family protein [Pseudomonadota bacterium]